jgi:hypothetical protein
MADPASEKMIGNTVVVKGGRKKLLAGYFNDTEV